jgi:hypothetical protein
VRHAFHALAPEYPNGRVRPHRVDVNQRAPNGGSHPKTVQAIAGHHTPAYARDPYCWFDRKTQRAAANSNDELFRGALDAAEIEPGNNSGNRSATTHPLTCEDMVPPREFET